LLQRRKGRELVGGGLTDLFFELAPGGGARVFAGLGQALRDRPDADVLASPVGTARVREQELDTALERAPEDEESRAGLAGHCGILPVGRANRDTPARVKGAEAVLELVFGVADQPDVVDDHERQRPAPAFTATA
jgi:hypothetical protein